MILSILILIPFVGGLLAWLADRWSALASRWVALLAMVAQLAVAVGLWIGSTHTPVKPGQPLLEFSAPWIPQLGIGYHLSMDGLSLLLLLLTGFIGILAVAASWTGVTSRVGLFHFNLLWTIAGIAGVFLAFDLFLFYVFWELILVPLYFLIDIWGHEQRHYAAVKFFIFTQTGGLFLLLGILGLVFVHGRATGAYTFDFAALAGTPMAPVTAFWLMLGFFVAFAVKLPAVPVHTWLPDAHTQAPVAGSVDLAGLVLKVGAYGLLRFVIPLFPAASFAFAPVAMTLAVVGIIYGALVAFGQTDLKRLVAYTSISHMGFALLGIYAWNEIALHGAIIVLIAHGLSTGAMFIVVGTIEQRLHTRDLRKIGGLANIWPRMGGLGIFFAVATLGLPGLANFVGEILVLFGAFRAAPVFASIAVAGFIVSVIYSVWIVYRVLWGPPPESSHDRDLDARETAMLLAAAALLVWFGLYPQSLISTSASSVRGLLNRTTPAMTQQSVAPATFSGEGGQP